MVISIVPLLYLLSVLIVGMTIYLLMRKPRIGVVVLLVLMGGVAVLILLWKPIYKTRTPRFAEEVKKAMDPAELQQWAMAVIHEAAQSNAMVEIPTNRVPAGIRFLTSDGSSLQHVYCYGGPESNSVVWFSWGGGFGHWGMWVGAPSAKANPDDEHFYYIEWKPGIYFWHETH